MEHYIISHTKRALSILVWLSLADTVRELPCSAFLAIWLGHALLGGQLEELMPTDVNESLLLEKLFGVLILKSLSRGFYTETWQGLDESCPRGQFTALLKLI